MAIGHLQATLRPLEWERDAVGGECETFLSDTIPKVSKKGYPDEMPKFPTGKIDELKTEMNVPRGVHSKPAMEPQAKSPDQIAFVIEKAAKCDKRSPALGKSFKGVQ